MFPDGTQQVETGSGHRWHLRTVLILAVTCAVSVLALLASPQPRSSTVQIPHARASNSVADRSADSRILAVAVRLVRFSRAQTGQALTIRTIRAPRATASQVSVSYPVAVPSGYGDPTGLTADPTGSGVWFYSVSAGAGPTVFFWNETSHSLTGYIIVDDLGTSLDQGANDPIVVDGSDVFVGVNHTLIILTVGSDTAQLVALPAVPTVRSDVERPPGLPSTVPLENFTVIDSLAELTPGELVVGRQYATDLEEYSVANGTFDSVALPSSSVLPGDGIDLEVTANATVNVVLYSAVYGRDVLASYLSSGSWNVQANSCDATSIAGTVTGFVATGQGCAVAGSEVTGSASGVTPISSAQSLTSVLSSVSIGIPLGSHGWEFGVPSGLELLSSASAAPEAISLGEVSVAASSDAVSNGPTTEPVELGLVSTTSDGSSTWFTVGNGGGDIGLVSLG